MSFPDDLKPGDKVIIERSRRTFLPLISEVERITSTLIVVKGGFRFNKKTLLVTGSGGFDDARISEATPERLAAILDNAKKNSLVNKLRNINWHRFSTEELLVIIEAIPRD